MPLEFLTPLSDAIIAHAMLQDERTLGNSIIKHTAQDGIPDLEKNSLALIGILENRRDGDAMRQVQSMDEPRMQLYELFPGDWDRTIYDLGDIAAGATVDDTYYAVEQVVKTLKVHNVIPLFLGGSQDLMYPIYRAFDTHSHMVNVVNVDHRFDLGNIEAPISSHSYVGKMVTEKPYNLFNYSVVGYQTHLNAQDEIELLDRMFFDALRLGEIDQDITLVEPLLRDADVVGMDISAVRAGDIAFAKKYPNGLTGKQMCRLSRYAGISDRVKVYGIFEQSLKSNPVASQLTAELLWYFIEGVHHRSGEHPVNVDNGFLKYKVLQDDVELVFYKSKSTGRWWMEMPFINHASNKLKQYTLLSCDRRDYDLACNKKLPERWLKARRKHEV